MITRVLAERPYRILLSLAFAWLAGNCLYVYLALDGAQAFRIESAAFIAAALSLPVVLLSREQPRPSAQLARGEAVGIGLVALTLWAAIFLPLLEFSFLSDDYVFLSLYRDIDHVSRAPQFFRPVFGLLIHVLSVVGGGSPVPFHLAGFLLHLSSAALVVVLAARLFSNAAAAVHCAVVFLLNPLQLEATLWVSGLQELLWTFFMLAALWQYTAESRLSIPRLATTMTLVAAGLASKETGVSFILLLPLADWAYFRFRRGRPLWGVYVGFAAELFAYLGIRRHFASVDQTFLELPSRFFLKQFVSLPYRIFVQPWNATAVQMPSIVPALVSVAIVALWWAAMRRNRLSARSIVGPLMVLASTLPLYTYFYVGRDLTAARYLYFPCVGWALLLTEFLLATLRVRRHLLIAACAVAFAYAGVLHENLRPWLTADRVVHEMRRALEQGRSADPLISELQRAYAPDLTLQRDVPYTYRGVGIFINGYREFVERYARTEDSNSRPN